MKFPTGVKDNPSFGGCLPWPAIALRRRGATSDSHDVHFAQFVKRFDQREVTSLQVDDIEAWIAEFRGQRSDATVRRTIGLDPKTADVLARYFETRDLEKMVAGPGGQSLVVCSSTKSDGGVRPDTFRRRSQKLVASSGLPAIGVHDTRHSYATATLAAGQPVKLVSERSGHANVGITLDIYAHALPGQDAVLATAVGALIDDED